jgi:hypothetical protein
LSLSVHHSKITTGDPPLRELPHLHGIGLHTVGDTSASLM